MTPAHPWNFRFSAENELRLKRLLSDLDKKEGRRVAVFDFDNTLIFNDLGDATFLHMVDRRLYVTDEAFWSLLPEKHGASAIRKAFEAGAHLPPQEARLHPSHLDFRARMAALYQDLTAREGARVSYPLVVSLLQGGTREGIRSIAEEVYDIGITGEVGDESWVTSEGRAVTVPKGIRPFTAMAQWIQSLHQIGTEVWIVTASFREIIAAVSGYWRIPGDRVVGMDLEETAGILGGNVLSPITYGEGKVAAIDRFIGVLPDFVAGDSPSDEAMLGIAQGGALLLDHGRSDLRERVSSRGGWIQPIYTPSEAN